MTAPLFTDLDATTRNRKRNFPSFLSSNEAVRPAALGWGVTSVWSCCDSHDVHLRWRLIWDKRSTYCNMMSISVSNYEKFTNTIRFSSMPKISYRQIVSWILFGLRDWHDQQTIAWEKPFISRHIPDSPETIAAVPTSIGKDMFAAFGMAIVAVRFQICALARQR